MQNRTFARISSTVLIAALLGFSGTGLAQQNAVHALDGQASTSTVDETTPRDQSLANSLAADLDAYNAQDNANRGPSTRMPKNHKSHRVARQIRELGNDVDAYNNSATDGRVPQTHMPASNVAQASDHARAERLADRVAAFNQSGGDLSSVEALN